MIGMECVGGLSMENGLICRISSNLGSFPRILFGFPSLCTENKRKSSSSSSGRVKLIFPLKCNSLVVVDWKSYKWVFQGGVKWEVLQWFSESLSCVVHLFFGCAAATKGQVYGLCADLYFIHVASVKLTKWGFQMVISSVWTGLRSRNSCHPQVVNRDSFYCSRETTQIFSFLGIKRRNLRSFWWWPTK